jgi:16S rRNA processing protein RimM
LTLPDTFEEVGFIKKIHGVNGQVRLRAHRHFEEAISNAPFLFLELYGEIVPFAVKSIHGENPFIIQFEDVPSAEEAENIKSTKVYLPVGEVPDINTTGEESELTGFSITLQDGQRIGKIVRVEEFPEQLMATVRLNKDNREILIPLNDTFIDRIDLENKNLQMDLPDGILYL